MSYLKCAFVPFVGLHWLMLVHVTLFACAVFEQLTWTTTIFWKKAILFLQILSGIQLRYGKSLITGINIVTLGLLEKSK